ncbi:MAG: glycosyltransferase family 2 protein [Bacteroidetes bacterium]|nr:glycosyltransferase family 2 protein [Bacteroidota bacterium]
MKKIAIVILNWNGKEFLKKFLPAVIKYSDSLARIIVADNASSDDSIALLSQQFPSIEIIQLDKNYGFTGGYNRALQGINEEFYVLLNSDVEVTPNWLQLLLSFMQNHPEAAACQPKIKSYQDRNLFEHAGAAGGYIDYLGYPFCRGRILNCLEEDLGQYDSIQRIFWATGACLFIRSKVFHEHGGFDDDFFAHMEEIDLCWRIQQTGKEIYIVPESQVFHVGGGTLSKSNPRKTYFNFRNNLFMLFKNLPGHQLIWLIPTRLFLDGLAGLKFFMNGDFKDTTAVLKSHLSFYRYAFTNFSKRSKQQHQVLKHPSRGIYRKSIVCEFFIHKKKHFKDLPSNNFS